MASDDEDRIADEYAPEREEAEYLIESLLEATGDRQRLRGKKGQMLRELSALQERFREWDSLQPDEKRYIVNRLWILNSGDDHSQRHEMLGHGRFSWREKGRPSGNHSGRFPSDEEMIQEALTLVDAEGLKLGAALRRVVVARGKGGFSVESTIKRLRRQISRRAS